MSAKERIKEYKAGKEVDFLPYKLQAADQALAGIYGFSPLEYAGNAEIRREVLRRKKEDFGLESYTVGLGLRTLGCAVGSTQKTAWHGMSQIDQYVLGDYADMGRLEIPNPRQNRKLAGILEEAHELQEQFPDFTMQTCVAGPLTAAVSMRPIEKILRDMRKTPEDLHRLLDFCVDGTLQWVEVFHQEFGTVDISFSDPVTCLDIISEKTFAEFSFPYMKKMVDGVEQIMGIRPTAHICGKTAPIWKQLSEIGITSLSLDNSENLEEAKRRLGGKMMISGNVPPVDVMRNGTIDEVIAACRRCIEQAADSPNGYMVNTGCQLPVGTPKENVEAYVYAVRKYGRRAVKGKLPEGLNAD
jgi:uroporphyrinogen decarboxylase